MVGQRPGLFAQFVLVPAADDQDLDVGEPLGQRGQRAHQHRHPLARFVEPAEEQHRLAGARVSVQLRRRRERLDVDAVGDLHGVGAERLHLPAPGKIGHRDAADDLLVHTGAGGPERR